MADNSRATDGAVFARQVFRLLQVVNRAGGGCDRIAKSGQAVSVCLEGIFGSIREDEPASAGMNANQALRLS